MLRKTIFLPENYYHIYNRGTDKRAIFLNDEGYFRFIALLYICNNIEPVNMRNFFLKEHSLKNIFKFNRKQKLVEIGAYCLMPNHFHLLIREKNKNGITLFMKKLCTSYVMYFNQKNERNGNLFQGRFKAELVDKDEYLNYLFAYIHLNPIKLIQPNWKEEGIKNFNRVAEFIKNYQWSSYQFYKGIKQKDPLLDNKEFPEYSDDFNEFKNFTDHWSNYQNNQVK